MLIVYGLQSWMLDCSIILIPRPKYALQLLGSYLRLHSLVYIPCLEHGVNIWDIFGGIKAAVVLLLAAKGVKVVYNVPTVRTM